MKKPQNKNRKSVEEYQPRDKTRDRTGVKATRRDARKRKDSRRGLERGDWQ